VSLGVLVVQSGHQLDQAHHRTDALATVLHAGDAHVTHAEGVTTVVSRTQNRGVLLTDLPPPPSGRTYQVWAIDARYHSAGLIVGGITEFTGITTASHVAVTIEPAGGSTQPTATPIVLVAIP
jgi:anti-sigma-K factor RskA